MKNLSKIKECFNPYDDLFNYNSNYSQQLTSQNYYDQIENKKENNYNYSNLSKESSISSDIITFTKNVQKEEQKEENNKNKEIEKIKKEK